LLALPLAKSIARLHIAHSIVRVKGLQPYSLRVFMGEVEMSNHYRYGCIATAGIGIVAAALGIWYEAPWFILGVLSACLAGDLILLWRGK
jgi:hypothetical protein